MTQAAGALVQVPHKSVRGVARGVLLMSQHGHLLPALMALQSMVHVPTPAVQRAQRKLDDAAELVEAMAHKLRLPRVWHVVHQLLAAACEQYTTVRACGAATPRVAHTPGAQIGTGEGAAAGAPVASLPTILATLRLTSFQAEIAQLGVYDGMDLLELDAALLAKSRLPPLQQQRLLKYISKASSGSSDGASVSTASAPRGVDSKPHSGTAHVHARVRS